MRLHELHAIGSIDRYTPLALSVCVLMPAIGAWAGPTVIDFGPAFGAPADEVSLTNQLQSYGVTFSSVSPEGVCWFGTTHARSAYGYCINAGWEPPWASIKSIRVDFSPLVDQVSIRGYDAGGDTDTLVLKAFDQSDALVDTQQFTSVFEEPGSVVSVSVGEIAYVTFEVQGTYSGLFFDDLTYTPIPEPAPLWLLVLVGFAVICRKL